MAQTQPGSRRSSVSWRWRPSQLGTILKYFAEQAGYRPGLRRQLREAPFNTPGLPSHAAMPLVRSRTHAAVAVATSPAVPEARAPLAVNHQTVSTARLSAVDFFRGLAIMEVVTHHSTTMAMRHLEKGSAAFLGTVAVNQTLHFAVPAFIFLSSTVLTRSLLKDFQPVRYYWRRLLRGAWPYVLWSALYVVWYVVSGRRPPSVLTNPERWGFYLTHGKASYHLYFMLVALQLYAVLPLLLPLARRRLPIWAALALGLALQVGAYFLNREVLRVPYPASTLLWYLLPVVLGVTVGSRLSEFSEWFRKYRLHLAALLALVFPPYLAVSMGYVLGQPVTPVIHNGFSWAYSSLVALILLGLSYQTQRSTHPLRILIAQLGTVSLQVYLIHPFMLQALEKWYAPERSDPTGLTFLVTLVYALTVLTLPALLGRFLNTSGETGQRLSVWLFGR